MSRRDEVTTVVRVTGFVEGYPPRLSTSKRVRRSDGREKVITQIVAVTDEALWRRLIAEVGEGDAIEVTVVTEWSEEGYATHLARFAIPAGRKALAASIA